MNVILVGGHGYLGSRVRVALEADGAHPLVVDPGILQKVDDCSQDVLKMPYHYHEVEGDVVVWLASIHEVPESSRLVWQDIAYDLMVKTPMEWAAAVGTAGGRFIYISSTRAGTHPDGLYGWNKRRFELLTAGDDHVTVIRPGTIWGGLSETLPNRTQTVINKMLTSDWLPEPLWEPFFTCHIDIIVNIIQALLVAPDHRDAGLIRTATDTFIPITGADLAGGWRPPGYAVEPVPDKIHPECHPMELYEAYYFGERNAPGTA